MLIEINVWVTLQNKNEIQIYSLGDLTEFKLYFKMCFYTLRETEFFNENIAGLHSQLFLKIEYHSPKQLFGVLPVGEEVTKGIHFLLLCSLRFQNAVGLLGKPPVCTTSLLCVGICITGYCRIPKTSVLSTAW